MSTPFFTIWGRLNSHNVKKVAWFAEELSLKYQRHDIGGKFGFTDEYLAKNPNRLIPTIEDGKVVLWESNAILRYMAAEYGGAAWFAADPIDRALADRWMDWQFTYADAQRAPFLARLTYLLEYVGVALDLGLRGSRKDGALVVDKAELVVGETAVRVTGSVTDFDAPRLAFTAKADSVAPEAFGAGDSGDRLRDLDVKGQFRFPESGVNGTLALTSPEGVYTGAPYRNLRVEAGVAGGRITVDRFSVDAFQGQLVARGHYDLERSAFDGSAELAQMRIEELVATRSKPAADLLSGALSGDLSVNGAGSNWKEIERALAGTGELRIEDGTLGKFNPARQLFTALGGLPSLRGGGLVQFVNSHPRLFGTEEAPFQAMSGRLRIRDGWLLLRNFALRTADYDLQGEGRVSLGGVVDVKTQMVLSPALSQELVAAAPPLRYLRQPSGRIEIPVALRGEMSQVAVVPDVSSIAASAGRELLVDALSGALGGKTREDAPSGQPAPAKPEDVGRELLRQGLEGLFGGGKR